MCPLHLASHGTPAATRLPVSLSGNEPGSTAAHNPLSTSRAQQQETPHGR